MDAAETLLKKSALFLATALVVALPGWAQSQLIVSSTTVNLNDNQARSINVTSSGTATLTYTLSGVPLWLSTFSLNQNTTPDVLSFQIFSTNCGTCTANVTLTPSSGAPVVVTVTYSPGTGGGGTGSLVATPSSLTFSAFSGQSAGSQNVGLTTSSASVIINNIQSDQTWLSAQITAGSFTVTPAAPATLTVSANAFNLTNGQYTGHITLTPSVGTATTITVTINVGTGGSGNGTIIATPSALTFSAAVGSVASAQTVTLSTNSSTAVSILSANFDQSWLQGNLISGNLNSISSLTPATISITASALSLTNGQYVGHFTITPSSGAATVVTITFNVGTGGGGTTGTIIATPSSLTFSVSAAGQIAAAQTLILTTASSTATAIAQASFDQTWLAGNLISGSLQSVSSISPATLSITASAAALTTGTYTGHLNLTTSGGSTTSVVITFNVGTGSGGGGSCNGASGTITVSQSSFTFSYPSNTLSAILTTGTTNPNVPSFNATISTQSNWLLLNNLGNGTYSGFPLSSYTLSVNTSVAAGLATGTYSGTITLVNPNNSADTTTVCVSLLVNGGGGGGGGNTTTLTVYPTNVSFIAFPAGPSQSQSVVVNVPSGATVTMNAISYNGSFFSILSSSCNGTPNATFSCTFTGPQTLTVTVNPSILSVAGNYNGVLSFTSGGTTVSANVILSLVNPVSTLTVSPTALSFTAAAGSTAQIQDVTVALPTGAVAQVSLSSFNGNFYTVTSSSCSANPSNNPTCSFSGNQTLQVTVNPAVLSTTGSYNGTITITSGGASTTVSVNLNLTAGGGGGGGGGTTSTIAAPTALAFYYQTNSPVYVPQQLITVGSVGAFSATASVTTSQQWLAISTVGTTGPGYVIASVSPQGLAAGATYQGSITITSASGNVTIPVSLTVTSGIVIEPNTGTINISSSSAVAQSVVLTASDNSATPVSVGTPSASWVTAGTPTSTTTPSSFQVSFNLSGLCNGLNTANIPINASNAVNNGFIIPVVALVSGSTATGCGSGGTSTITASPTSLSFTSSGGTTPAAQTLSVSSSSGSVSVSFVYTVTGNVPITATTSLGTVTNGATLATPQSLSIAVSTSGLTAGQTYNGAITLTPTGGGAAVTIPVSLAITAVSVSATPTMLTFTYAAGSTAPSPQTVTVSGTAGTVFAASASSTGNWLSVSPSSGTVPATLSVSVNPTGLNANTYTGTVTVASANGASGSTTITVTLTVTAPLPTITSIGSAASYVGGALSPGEIITIFGTGIGPTPGATLTLDSTGKVATTLGGVQVLVNGILSPMIYASNTQVSAVVPYEICANGCGPGTIAQVSVKFLGASSNGIPTPVAATTTGVFTANASGSGQGAILNANLSANSAGNPANKGDIVAIYLTGEGQTSPAGVTGKVTTVSTTGPVTPVPLLPVAVLVDGQPASISFAGEAPGLVSGVMQLNFQIPPNARSGSLSVLVTIGSASSQQGVTVAVR